MADFADERLELLLSQIMTLIPYPAHFLARARPIPEAPPVIRAVLPDLKTGEAIVGVKNVRDVEEAVNDGKEG